MGRPKGNRVFAKNARVSDELFAELQKIRGDALAEGRPEPKNPAILDRMWKAAGGVPKEPKESALFAVLDSDRQQMALAYLELLAAPGNDFYKNMISEMVTRWKEEKQQRGLSVAPEKKPRAVVPLRKRSGRAV